MNDHSLRQAFHHLRSSEAARAPRFEQLWQARAVPRQHPALAFAFSLLILITVVMMFHRSQPQPSISAWRAPTDFLLKTPGQELLHSVPDLKGKLQ